MNKKHNYNFLTSLFFPVLFVLLLATGIQAPASFAAASRDDISAFEKLDGIFQEYLIKECIDENKSTYTDDQLKEMTDDLQTYLDQCDITTTYKEMEAVSRYVANRVSYNLNDKRSNPKHGTELTSDNPYDVWSSKRAVCGGYTNLLNTLLVSRGIPSFELITKTHAYSIAYDKQNDRWIYIDATGCSTNRYDLERDTATKEVLPNAKEVWTSGGYNSAGFDMTPQIMMQNRAAYMVYSCNYLIKDGLHYNFRCNDSSFNTSVDLDTWSDMTDWYVTLYGPWKNDYAKDVKVTNVGGVPIHKVYDGFAGTDIESVDFSETSIKMIVSKYSSTTGTFEGCTKLKTVKLPDTVTQFASQTFKDCTALEEINMPKSTLVFSPQQFSGCTSLKTVDFRGTSAVRLCKKLFKGCTSLTSVYLGEPENLYIESYAFQDCTNLETVDCSKTNISFIDNYAFYNCSKLTKIDLSGSTMEKTGQSIFRECTSLKEVILPKTLKELNYLTFCGTAIKTLDLRDTAITKISYMACSSMDALKSLYLPGTLEAFDDYAFSVSKSSFGKLYIYSSIPEADIRAMADKAEGVWSGRAISFPKGSYTITYDGNGAAAGTMDTQTCMIDGCSFTLAKNAYSRDGYTFAGWNTKADGSGDSYKDEDSVAPLTETDQDTITLYAMWKDSSEITYHIRYVLNINNAKNDNPKTYTNKSDAITLNAPVLDGYTFKGWFSDKDFTQKVTEIAKGSTGDITLYALWEKIDTCEHEWVDTGTIEKATCSQEGSGTRYCSKCGKTEVVTLPKNPDSHFQTQVINKKAATTTEEGYTGDTVCKACGKVIKAGEIIPKKSTSSNDPSASKAPASTKQPAGSGTTTTKNPAASNTPAATKKPSGSNTGTSTTDASAAPKAVKGLLVTNEKPLKLIISWTSDNTVKGYEVQYAMNKKFKKSVKKKNVKVNYLIIKKTKKAKTYYVRVRAYKLQGKKKIYSKWTKIKKIKIKQ